MSETFYSVRPDMPRVGIRVVVIWGGRQLTAARVHRAGRTRWVMENKEGGYTFLPPKGQEERWGPQPDAWRPEKAEAWKAPLPPPLISSPAVAKIESEHGPTEDGATRLTDHQWWLTELVTYSPAGTVSIREAEGRVARAILTDGIASGLGGHGRLRVTSSALSNLIQKTQLSSDTHGMRQLFKPSPRDLDDYDTAIAWFAALNPPELWGQSRETWTLSESQCVLVWRVVMSALSWRDIARQVGASRQGARLIYGEALTGVHRAANGQPGTKHVTVKERLATLSATSRRANVES